jgi:hypothetical protein
MDYMVLYHRRQNYSTTVSTSNAIIFITGQDVNERNILSFSELLDYGHY